MTSPVLPLTFCIDEVISSTAVAVCSRLVACKLEDSVSFNTESSSVLHSFVRFLANPAEVASISLISAPSVFAAFSTVPLAFAISVVKSKLV